MDKFQVMTNSLPNFSEISETSISIPTFMNLTSTSKERISQEQIGHLHHLRGQKGLNGYEVYTYAFAGAGIFYFNPKTTLNGKNLCIATFGNGG